MEFMHGSRRKSWSSKMHVLAFVVQELLPLSKLPYKSLGTIDIGRPLAIRSERLLLLNLVIMLK